MLKQGVEIAHKSNKIKGLESFLTYCKYTILNKKCRPDSSGRHFFLFQIPYLTFSITLPTPPAQSSHPPAAGTPLPHQTHPKSRGSWAVLCRAAFAWRVR